jgi:hypothetical protein
MNGWNTFIKDAGEQLRIPEHGCSISADTKESLLIL